MGLLTQRAHFETPPAFLCFSPTMLFEYNSTEPLFEVYQVWASTTEAGKEFYSPCDEAVV